jgi:hypothetical protein
MAVEVRRSCGAIAGTPQEEPLATRIVRLEAERSELDAKLADLRRQQREEDAEIAVLLIARAINGRTFSAVELLAHAGLDPELREALHGATTAKHVGRRLHELASATRSARVRLVRHSRNAEGCIWEIAIA